jgi:hypothetical protein
MLVHRPGGAFGYITDSWANTLRSAGHKVQRWDGLIESWKVFSPDLYIGSSGHRQPVPKDPSCKFAMHVNPYGPMDCGAINESADSIQYIRDMNPSLVFGYGFEEDRVYWQYWKEKLESHGAQCPPGLMLRSSSEQLHQNIVPSQPLILVVVGPTKPKALTHTSFQ